MVVTPGLWGVQRCLSQLPKSLALEDLLNKSADSETCVFQLWNLIILTSEMEFSAKVSTIKLTLFCFKLLVYGCKMHPKCWTSSVCSHKFHTKHLIFKNMK